MLSIQVIPPSKNNAARFTWTKLTALLAGIEKKNVYIGAKHIHQKDSPIRFSPISSSEIK